MEQNDPITHSNVPEEPAKKGTLSKKSEVLEWVKAFAIAAIPVTIIWFFFARPFIVDGPSMQPNFWTGERIIANQILYKFRQPKPGEVIVFHGPKKDQDLIKRVIGVAGDTIEYRGDDLYVNGNKVEEPYIKPSKSETLTPFSPNDHDGFLNQSPQPYKVPEGYIFVMGDNREESSDSRTFGPVPLENVIGRADVIFWPLSHATLIQHYPSKLWLKGS